MYKSFFGLRENPFNVNPDPRFLYVTPPIQEALDQLTYGIQSRKGFILLTGEVGTGKTTLINYLLDWLRQQKMSTAFIFNSHLTVTHLFDFILTDFGIPTDFGLKSNMLLRLNKWLIERFRAGETPVLIVDEAQGLSFELLEEIRLLLNLETASEKLLQIVLVGQPELEDKLKRPELRQLRQRITLRCNTAPLTLKESFGYIADRLRIGGATGDPIFAPEAIEAVYSYSRGIPRVMNLLCEHALINAYVEQFNPVPARMVEEAAQDFLLDESRAVTKLAGFNNHINNNLTVMQSIFASEAMSPSATVEAGLEETTRATWPPAQAAVAVVEPVLAAEKSSVATAPECNERSVSDEDHKASMCFKDLMPALPAIEGKQEERAPGVGSSASPADSAARLIAEMRRNLPAVSSNPSLHLMPPRGGNEPSSGAKNSQMSAPGSRTLSLDTMNRIPLGARRASIRALFPTLEAWRTVLLRSISPAAWSRLYAAVLGRIRRPGYAGQVVKRWIFEFKSDWNSWINATAFPELTKSLLRWLRETVPSKPKASG